MADTNAGIMQHDDYGFMGTSEEREEPVMLAEDADFEEVGEDGEGLTADDADELGEVYSGNDED
jgi:hypothetical protein